MTRVIYMHGFASGPSSRKATLFKTNLAAHGIAMEVPDLAENDFRNLTLTAQLRVLERTARGERVTLIGSSMGGYLAALYAETHPEVEKLLLLAPAFNFYNRWAEEMGQKKWTAGGSRAKFPCIIMRKAARCLWDTNWPKTPANMKLFQNFSSLASYFMAPKTTLCPSNILSRLPRHTRT